DCPPTVEAWLKRRESTRAEARDVLWTSRVRQAIQHNKKHRDQPPLLVGLWALLNLADRRGRHQEGVNKLKERFEGPYKISKVFDNGQDITLELPEGDHRHSIFHISKVKRFFLPEELSGVNQSDFV
ncbi:hypothetical protein PSTG_18643, partial [Puccinia striiformis f. sp. tritici PST-78]